MGDWTDGHRWNVSWKGLFPSGAAKFMESHLSKHYPSSLLISFTYLPRFRLTFFALLDNARLVDKLTIVTLALGSTGERRNRGL